MDGTARLRPITRLELALLTSAILAGCGGGGDSESDPAVAEDAEPDPTLVAEIDAQLTGSVGDGPVVGAAMRVLANDGTLLAEFLSSDTADYDVTVKTKGRNYPLSVDARDGTDLVTNLPPDFRLRGAVLEPSKRAVANINPYSTLAFEIALDMADGASRSNIQTAQNIAVTELNFGLSTLAATGPMTTEIDNSNIAEIVRASEAVGELIRRTRTWLGVAGITATGDEIVQSLGADLVDEVIDGRGGPDAAALTAAIASVVGAQIALETMANELHVNGVDGTAAMAGAIQTVSSGITQTLDELAVTAGILFQARIGLAAASSATGHAAVAALLETTMGLQAGNDSTLVGNRLPADYRQTLDNALTLIATGDQATIDEVNATVRSADLTDGTNRPPTIGGTPASTIQVNYAYRFTPTASDADGDNLTFSMQGLPSWASFDSNDGTISGTPGVGDVNTYNGMSITASDGAASATLGPFSVTVEALGTGTATLSWTPPTSNTDGSTLNNLAGYRIYWGQNHRYPNSVTIDNLGVTTFVIDNFPTGSWDFVSTAFNAEGVESGFSNVVTKVIQ